MTEHFHIKTGVFEGPLSLLLSLIEERKLLINDVSLAQVTDDYIAYVQSLDNLPTEQSANFILIASTLLLIKSKSLLPTLDLTGEEEASIDDLETRLRLYQRFRELAASLRELYGSSVIYPRGGEIGGEPLFAPDKKTTTATLLACVRSVLAGLPKGELLPKAVVKQVMSIEEMIDRLAKRVAEKISMSFREFSGNADKVHVIVTFLAMLELVKQGIVSARQDGTFSDITIESEGIGTPNYR